ncbi:MAG: four helix bundle protein [Saprospirales bacterium]|nr:four helix bundle protein [Saprospirales bacterium]
MKNRTPWKSNSLIEEKSFSFSLKIIGLYRKLKDQKEYDIGRQILRSGTSIGANVSEALAAQSKKDFISKMAIASKESRETHYWLRLLKESHLAPIDLNPMLSDCEEIIRIQTAIVKTSIENLKTEN